MQVEKSLTYNWNPVFNLEQVMIFQTAICGYSNNKLITILPSPKRMLPYTIIVNDTVFESLKFDLAQGNNSIDLSDYRCERVHLLNLCNIDKKREINRKSISEIRNFIELFQMPDSNLFSKIENNIDQYGQVIAVLKMISMDQSPEINLLGYGKGLTPEVDDFFLGILSLLLVLNKKEKVFLLKEYINRNKNNSTTVSNWMLTYAIEENLFPEIVLEFYKTNDIMPMLNFLEHGSSSGLDILTGIYYGMKCLV